MPTFAPGYIAVCTGMPTCSVTLPDHGCARHLDHPHRPGTTTRRRDGRFRPRHRLGARPRRARRAWSRPCPAEPDRAFGRNREFLAGGEFPIPLSQGLGTTTIEYKKYGVSLAYTPTCWPTAAFRCACARKCPSCRARARSLNGFQIPALTVRRAETTVELGSGQSFMIAGLLSNNAQNTIDKAPGVGDLPILGNLFRSTEFRKGETELVIVVTPYLVNPVERSARSICRPTASAPRRGEQILLNGTQRRVRRPARPMPRAAETRANPSVSLIDQTAPRSPAEARDPAGPSKPARRGCRARLQPEVRKVMTMPIAMKRLARAHRPLLVAGRVPETPAGIRMRHLAQQRQPAGRERSNYTLDLAGFGRPAGSRKGPPGGSGSRRWTLAMAIASRSTTRWPARRCARTLPRSRPLWPAAQRWRPGHRRLCRSGQGARGGDPFDRPCAELPKLVGKSTGNLATTTSAGFGCAVNGNLRGDGRRSRASARRCRGDRRNRGHELEQGHRDLSRRRSRPVPAGCRKSSTGRGVK
jgi:hypothetical protein